MLLLFSLCFPFILSGYPHFVWQKIWLSLFVRTPNLGRNSTVSISHLEDVSWIWMFWYIYICWIYFDVSWMYSTCVGHTLDLFWIVLDIYVGFFGCVTVWCLNDVSSRMWEDVWCWFVSPESDDFSRLIPLHRTGFGSPLLSLSLEKNKKNLLDLVSLALGHSWVFSQPLKLNLPNKSLFIEGFLVTKNHSSGWLNPSQSPRKSILNWLRVAGCRR